MGNVKIVVLNPETNQVYLTTTTDGSRKYNFFEREVPVGGMTSKVIDALQADLGIEGDVKFLTQEIFTHPSGYTNTCSVYLLKITNTVDIFSINVDDGLQAEVSSIHILNELSHEAFGCRNDDPVVASSGGCNIKAIMRLQELGLWQSGGNMVFMYKYGSLGNIACPNYSTKEDNTNETTGHTSDCGECDS